MLALATLATTAFTPPTASRAAAGPRRAAVRAGSSQEPPWHTRPANLEGGARATRTVAGAAGPRGLAAFLGTPESDAALLNTATYARTPAGAYECTLEPIQMLSYSVVPEITVRIERAAAGSSLTIRVLAVRVSLRRGARSPRYLQGAVIDSANTVRWADAAAGASGGGGDGGVELSTDLTLRISVRLPRRFPLPRAAIEAPGSRLLLSVCAAQCRGFLGDIEAGYREWEARGGAAADGPPEAAARGG